MGTFQVAMVRAVSWQGILGWFTRGIPTHIAGYIGCYNDESLDVKRYPLFRQMGVDGSQKGPADDAMTASIPHLNSSLHIGCAMPYCAEAVQRSYLVSYYTVTLW